jgi:hypothetical protein
LRKPAAMIGPKRQNQRLTVSKVTEIPISTNKSPQLHQWYPIVIAEHRPFLVGLPGSVAGASILSFHRA